MIKFDLSEWKIKNADELKNSLVRETLNKAEKFGVEIKLDTSYEAFHELIRKVFQKHGRVVILVDDYDKPLLDNIQDTQKAKEIADVLRGFYQVIKPADPYLEFVFITGVSKFSLADPLSGGLNNLLDITLAEKYNEICGFTQEELERTFADKISELVEQVGDNILEKIKHWYGGWSWGGDEKLCNPFDVLMFLQEKEFRPFWFEVGNPEIIVKMLVEHKSFIPRIERFVADDLFLGRFDVGNVCPETLLFQMGYLTIKEKRETFFLTPEYIISYPNYNVKKELTDSILDILSKAGDKKLENQKRLREVIEKNDFEGMRELFSQFFDSIPADWYRKNLRYEGYCASIFYAYFTSAGFDVNVENTPYKSEIDITVLSEDRVYVFGFRVLKDGEEKRDRKEKWKDGKGTSLKQIKEKRYWENYSAQKVYLVGIDFELEKRSIISFEWEKLT